MEVRLTNLRQRSLPTRGALLALALAGPCLLVAVPIAFWCNGLSGVLAAGAAGTICLIGSGAALAVNEPFRGTDRALYGLLWSMAFRMGIPLGLGLALYLGSPTLAGAGFLMYLLVFFELALAVEVYLSLPAPAKADQSETK